MYYYLEVYHLVAYAAYKYRLFINILEKYSVFDEKIYILHRAMKI